MSTELRSANGRYLAVQQDDGNFVVYRRDTMTPVWDQFGYEARGDAGPAPTPPSIPTPRAPDVVPPDTPRLDLDPTPASGLGLVEHAALTAVRSRLSRAEIATFVPESPGAFRFPRPYGTRGIRLTSANDGVILPVGYSYWSQINNHAGRGELLVFLGTGAGQPILLQVDKSSGVVTNRGPIGDLRGTGEGWYFSATRPTTLYTYGDASLVRYDVDTNQREVVFALDPGLILWQMCSSDDDQVHAGTYRQLPGYTDLGCCVYRNGKLSLYPKRDGYDECQLDKSGRWLIIKEGAGGGDNRVIDLETGEERTIHNADGAVGHSDTGAGFVAGEDDQHEPGALVTWDLAQPFTPENRHLHYHLTQWVDSKGVGIGLGHVAVRGNRALVSHAHREDIPRINELGVVTLDGSRQIRLIAPNLMDVDGGGGDDYAKQVKANWDPTGQYACWTANAGTDRLDAFLVEVPS